MPRPSKILPPRNRRGRFERSVKAAVGAPSPAEQDEATLRAVLGLSADAFAEYGAGCPFADWLRKHDISPAAVKRIQDRPELAARLLKERAIARARGISAMYLRGIGAGPWKDARGQTLPPDSRLLMAWLRWQYPQEFAQPERMEVAHSGAVASVNIETIRDVPDDELYAMVREAAEARKARIEAAKAPPRPEEMQ